jgi:AcrR family transcriptional regulator
MLPQGEPKWRRRAEARPGEIVSAALEIFVEKGFAAARLEDIAARAGISKGALYIYFETKQDLFQAVVRTAILPNLEQVLALANAHEGSAGDLLRLIFLRLGGFAQGSRVGAVAKVVIGESRNFPDLARVWHEELVAKGLGLVAAVIARGQASGEFRAGAPDQLAVGLFAPVIVGEIWRETFVPVGARPFDLPALLEQHVEVFLRGLRP